MLTEDSEMSETRGIVLTEPGRGVAFQIAGALQRLGRRMIGLIEGPESLQRVREIPMQTYLHPWQLPQTPPLEFTQPFASLVVTPEPALGRNAALDAVQIDAILRLVNNVAQLQPSAEIIVLVPKSTPQSEVSRLRRGLPARHVLFLTPAIWGFRDEGLMDQALEMLQQNPAALTRVGSPTPGEWVFSGDVAAFVVSSAGREELYGKILDVPAGTTDLEEWRDAFVRAFAPQVSTWQRWKAKLQEQSLAKTWRALPGAESPIANGARETLSLESLPALSQFPTALTPLSRALSAAARVHQRNPDLGMHFPPGRSP